MSSQRSNLQPFGPQLSGRNCDFPQADFWPAFWSAFILQVRSFDMRGKLHAPRGSVSKVSVA
jgi:hypothetical protein